MPKSFEKRICEAQRQRVLISDRGDKYGPSKVTLQVIGSGARGAPKSVYLFTDKKRYLFNCGEGTQRLAHEHKMKLALLENIFITTNTWDSMGGLPGISLTLQDVGVPKLNLHGPPGLKTLYKAMDRFMMMNHLDIGAPDCDPLVDFEDSTMTVKYVPLALPKSNYDDTKLRRRAEKILEMEESLADEFEHDDTEYYPHYTKRNKSRSPSPTCTQGSSHSPKREKRYRVKAILDDMKSTTVNSMAYICTLKKRLGTLDKKKCMSLGLKAGPWLGQLKRGEDVVLPDGTLLQASQFKTPDEPGSVFIVIDVPNMNYLKESDFKAYMDTPDVPRENIPAVVVHFTPKHIFNSSRYLQFLRSFGPQTKHMLVNDHNTCLGSMAVHRMQHKLHVLSPHIFPLLREHGTRILWTPSSAHQTVIDPHASKRRKDDPDDIKEIEQLNSRIAVAQFESIISAESEDDSPDISAQGLSLQAGVPKEAIVSCRSLTAFHLLPKNGLDRTNEYELNVVEFISESMSVPGFPTALKRLQRRNELAHSPHFPYPRLVFLGTGSCIPNKTRNTSGIILEIDENRVMMLDCGEGTYGQLVRFYGMSRANRLLRNLKVIYISHLHADHHIGLIGVLQGRRRAFEEVESSSSNGAEHSDLHLLAPGQIMTWLSIYNAQFEEIKQEYILVPNTTLLQNEDQPENVLPSSVLSEIGVASIQTCFVRHCPNAFGVAITTLGNEKITYSGDTMPCDSLVALGQDSHILIHEATMEDELEKDAHTKRHSTTSQAIEAGRRMGAEFTLLTHFSQRYARLPRFTQPLLDSTTNVGIAFDNMQVSIPDLQLLPHMYESLQLMFAEHCNELEVKAAKRAVRENQNEPDPNTPGTKTHGLTIAGPTPIPSPTNSPDLTVTPGPTLIPSPIITSNRTTIPTSTHETNETQCTAKDMLGDISKIVIKSADPNTVME